MIEAVKVPPELIMVGDIGLSSWLITEVEKLIEGSHGSAHLGKKSGFEFIGEPLLNDDLSGSCTTHQQFRS